MDNQKIGNYQLIKTIGEGTFGKVKLGIHQLTQESVAVKILDKDKILQQGDVERVTREINILRKVRHPQIVQLYEIIENDEQLFLIMQFAPGGELFDYIVKCQRVSEKETCKFLQQILSGVEYLHQFNIVHRDLKPENLLLDQNRNIKIVDFGLSNTYRPNEPLKTACGSPCYAPPEMIAGLKYDGLKADIWSSGVILFALLCGYLPFDDPDTQILYNKIMNGKYDSPSYLTKEAKQLLQGILNIDPGQRMTIEEIRKSEFYLKNITMPEPQLELNVKIDEDVLVNLAQSSGVQSDYIKQQIQNNRHNHITTYYYLLKQKMDKQEKRLRQEQKSKNSIQLNIMAQESQQQDEYKEKSHRIQINVQKQRVQSPKLKNISIDLKNKQAIKIELPEQEKIQFNVFTPKGNAQFQFKKQFDYIQNAAKKQNKSIQINDIKSYLCAQPLSPKVIKNHPKNKSIDQNPTDFKAKVLDVSKIKKVDISKTNKSPSRAVSPQSTSDNQSANTYFIIKKKENQEVQGCKMHFGNVNVNCVSTKSPQELVNQILFALKILQIQYLNIGNFEIQVFKDLYKYSIEIRQLQNYCSYLHFQSLKGSFLSNTKNINGLIMHLKL